MSKSKTKSKHQGILEWIQGLQENAFTTTVLKPLLLKRGYSSVEFFGGVTEEGKDLICRHRETLGDIEVTVVQVKKFKNSGSTSDESTFATLVTQLSQAAEKKIPILETGNEQLPDKIVMVTPYLIDTKSLKMRFEGYQTLRGRGLKICDGQWIATSLIDYAPELIPHPLKRVRDIDDTLRNQLNNDALMSVLRSESQKRIEDFHTDLNFSIGKTTTRLFLFSAFTPAIIAFESTEKQWHSLLTVVDRCNEMIGSDLLDRSPTEIEKEALERFEEYKKMEEFRVQQREALTALNDTLSEIDNWISEVEVAWSENDREYRSQIAKADVIRRQLLIAESKGAGNVDILKNELNETESRCENAKTGFHPIDLKRIKSIIQGKILEGYGALQKSILEHQLKWIAIFKLAGELRNGDAQSGLSFLETLLKHCNKENVQLLNLELSTKHGQRALWVI